MKKILATVMAASMAMGTAAVVSAASLELNTPAGASGDYEFSLVGAESKSYVDIATEGHYLYTFGTDSAKEKDFIITLENGAKLRADVQDGQISVSQKKLADNQYKVTVKAKAGVRDFDLEKFTVELDISDLPNGEKDKVFYIKGKVAYSDTQEVASDERYTVSESNGSSDGTTGSIFNFDEAIDEETRIRVNDYVDLYFKGNYGTDKENLRVVTEAMPEVEEFFGDADINVYDFIGNPKFASSVKVIIDGDANSYLYELDRNTGDLTKVDAKYESNGWSFTTKKTGHLYLNRRRV